MSNILNMSIEEMHASLKEKKIKPSDLVKASIEKAKENQETYNAFVTILEEALELSYELDNNFEEDNPLYGIPYAAKDNFSTKDILSTGSSNILNNYVPVYDATVISKLKNRKTVLIGKTTLDELAMGGTGMNTHTGPCKNPYTPQYHIYSIRFPCEKPLLRHAVPHVHKTLQDTFYPEPYQFPVSRHQNHYPKW